MTSPDHPPEPIALTTDNLPDIVYLVDIEEQRNVFINKSVQTVLLYSEADIQEMGSDLFPTIIHPDDLRRIGVHYEQLATLEDGHSAVIEYRVRRKDGKYLWYRSTDTIYERKPDGAPKLLLGSAYDITLAKQREETISLLNRELAHRIQNLFAVNLSLVRLARRQGGELDTVLEDLESRMLTLGAVQSRIRDNGQSETRNLRDLLQDVFAALTVEDRIALDVGDIPISEPQLNSIGIILYELFVTSTLRQSRENAAPTLQVQAQEDKGTVTLTWRDRLQSEPFDSEAGRQSMVLVRQAVSAMQGTLEMSFADPDFRVKLRFPVAGDRPAM